jgi:peptidyl-prolyl cis-trans isomerase-like 2
MASRYISHTEWKQDWGGKKDKAKTDFQPLSFNCCALSFLPFEDPVCTADGTVYDILFVTVFFSFAVSLQVHALSHSNRVQQHRAVRAEVQGRSDVGQAAHEQGPHQADLLQEYGRRTPLSHHLQGTIEFIRWPSRASFSLTAGVRRRVVEQVFTDHSRIVAVRPSGNVYSWEAIDELNVKAKNWKDLLSGESFTRDDIITLQDPQQKRNAASAWHIVQGLSAKGTQKHNHISRILTFHTFTHSLTEKREEIYWGERNGVRALHILSF